MFARHPLSAATLEALGSVARQIAVGIERKRAEAALAEREERIRLLLDSTAEAIYGSDAEGRCTLANLIPGLTYTVTSPRFDVFHTFTAQGGKTAALGDLTARAKQ